MIIIYSLIAIFIAYIWIDYYRMIDIFESEKFKYIIATFIMGALSVYVVLAINEYILDYFNFELNGNFLNDFLYCTFKIGAVEELAKLLPFLIIYFFLRKELDEPIDYIVFITASALGFSALENIFYFKNHGAEIINGRAILSTVGHMFDSAIVAYGIMRFVFHPKHKNNYYQLFLFFFLGSLSHGIYDFWLMYEKISYGFILTIIYFFFTLSIYAVIMNNSLNNSPYFSYSKVIDSNLVAYRLLFYYAIVFALQVILLTISNDIHYAMSNFFTSLLTTGFIVFVTVVRLSRFKLIHNRWENIKLEFPLSISFGGGRNVDGYRTTRFFRLKVKGPSYNEIYINKFYGKRFKLRPVNKKHSYIKKSRDAVINEKHYLNNDIIFYIATIYHGKDNLKETKILISPKTIGKFLNIKSEPVVAIYEYEGQDFNDPDNFKLKFREWAIAYSSKEQKALETFKALSM